MQDSSPTDFTFSEIIDVLQWTPERLDTLTMLNDRYVSLLKTKLLQTVRYLRQTNHAVDTLINHIGNLSDEDIDSLVAHPPVADLLINPGRYAPSVLLATLNRHIEDFPSKHTSAIPHLEFDNTLPFMSEFFPECRSLTLGEQDLARSRLIETFDYISSVSRATREAVQRFTSLLVLKAADAHTLESSSFAGTPGVALIFNAGADFATRGVLTDAIVHETVHGILHQIELVSGMFIDYQVRADERLRSPWTQNPLDAETLVHATFVWWGLENFWQQAAKFDSNPEVEELRLQAVQGFRNWEVNHFEAIERYGTPDLLRAIQQIIDMHSNFISPTYPTRN